MSPPCERFGQGVARFRGGVVVFAVAGGRADLPAPLIGWGRGAGDEVILPSLNFVAAANSVLHVGANPVFCDIQGAHDLNLDPADVEAGVTPRTRAILALHYGGGPCDPDPLVALADRHRLDIIHDAA